MADAVDRHGVKHLEAKFKLDYRLYIRPSPKSVVLKLGSIELLRLNGVVSKF